MIGWFALTALGWLAESIMVALVGKAVDRAVQQFGEQRGVEDDLEKLKDSLVHARLTISTVECLRINDEVLQQRLKELLIRLKNAAYDADDLLDEFQYRILKQQIEQQGDEAGKQASSSFYSAPPPSKRTKTSIASYTSGLFRKGDDDDDDDNVQKIRKILDDNSAALEKIYSSLGAGDDRGKKQLVSSASRQTSSFSTEPQLFGRDKELQELKDLFLKPAVASEFGQSGVSVLSIYGMGGIGKTTLAQEVFNDSSVKEYFKLRIWVCVSEYFCIDRLTREIVECATTEKCDLTNLATLQKIVNEKITPERFLLVLDDVWNEDRHKWEILCAPLRSGKPGSKILVTTRSRKIADMVSDVDAIHLQALDEESFWEFFKKCAFGCSNSGAHHPHMEAMAKQMTHKLKGLPLAAKALGGLLSMKLDEQYWENILDSEIWQLPQEENGIMPVLQLSYQHLPPHLKQCFAFCSLFPKDYKFSESELIGIWMAEGFIVPRESTRMEELGSNYFHELVNRSFFQKSKHGEFIMHDLMHDLAELISADESYRVEEGKSHDIPCTIRHLSIYIEKEDMLTRLLTEFSHWNELRTMMLSIGLANMSLNFDFGFLEKLKNIRVLVMKNRFLKELPNSIDKLIHLRYLDLYGSYNIERLPESLCNLYNLQTLKLYGYHKLERLPHDMMKLINLRNLTGVVKLIADITEVGKLASLQNLPAFKVTKDNGHKLAELNGLKQLRGILRITNLENVENKNEANIASLKSKEHLNRLELEWTSLQDVDLHISEQVLEGLQPHHNLQRLTIRGYNGARPPNWLYEQVYSRLEGLKLENCKSWNDLSVIGQLPQLKSLSLVRIPVHTQNLHKLFDPKVCKFFSQLKSLVLEGITMLEDLPNLGQLPCLTSICIENLPGVKMIGDKFFAMTEEGSCFPRLCTLRFTEMPTWEEFYGSDNRNLFPCLVDLDISNCQKLQTLPALPPSIQHVKLKNVGLVDCPRFWKAIDECSSTTTSVSLTYLSIQNCPNLTSLDPGLLPHHLFPCLVDLDISNCQKLQMLPPLPPSIQQLKLNNVGLVDCPRFWKAFDEGSSTTNSATLTYLSIQNCPHLTSLEPVLLPHHLQHIHLKKCEQLSWVPVKKLKELTSLRSLSIEECPKLMSMSTPDEYIDFQLPPSIEKLCLTDCGNLSKSLPGLLSLTPLLISKFPNLVSFPLEPWPRVIHLEIQKTTNNLELLRIKGCPNLLLHIIHNLPVLELEIDDTAFMKQSPIKNLLSSVSKLTISSLGEAVMFEGEDQESLQSLTSLQKLCFSDCWNLQSLPTKLYTLKSLRVLMIHNCPQIQSLPDKGLPPSLIEIGFKDCDPALEQQLTRHLVENPKIRFLQYQEDMWSYRSTRWRWMPSRRK
ncbi:putative disease resistance protein RGA3 isoform X1 [Zingiber officinale]|uniref:putative disease resistance protein RGA3 isoform X1 n=1 Tax=Zingiber officinale TaxID=94328 RepID=UPI001C4CCB71|nr:putative disease resistance protein RGA3 isoform X1 [Zingiber officinale]